jgi:chloride channel 7
MGFNLLLAFSCSLSLFLISPAASGSGIPDVKAYLNGVDSPIFRNFFTVKTFVAKVIGSALGVASSLVMGKEGPMLHAGSILAVILGTQRWYLPCFQQIAGLHATAAVHTAT